MTNSVTSQDAANAAEANAAEERATLTEQVRAGA